LLLQLLVSVQPGRQNWFLSFSWIHQSSLVYTLTTEWCDCVSQVWSWVSQATASTPTWWCRRSPGILSPI
jgi:hypothetical protein